MEKKQIKPPKISVDKLAEALQKNIPLYLEEGRIEDPRLAKLIAFMMVNAQTIANGFIAQAKLLGKINPDGVAFKGDIENAKVILRAFAVIVETKKMQHEMEGG